jgi:hypothetical protein
MNTEVKMNETTIAMFRKKAKKNLTTIISLELWDRLVAYQEKHNADDRSIGKVSVNSLIESAIKQFLIDK